MGGWFSSFLTLKTFLYRPKNFAISAAADPNPDPFVLLSAAAEIAALHRSMEDTSTSAMGTIQMSANQPSASFEDTDVEDSLSSLLHEGRDDTSSEEGDTSDEACRRTCERSLRLLEKKKAAFRSGVLVGNNQTLKELREDVLNRCYRMCAASTSITDVCTNREIAKPRGGTCMPSGMKSGIANQFLPNCRRIVDKLRSKSFCCQFVKGGDELVVASQVLVFVKRRYLTLSTLWKLYTKTVFPASFRIRDHDERIRFFQQYGPRDRYFLKDTVHVPITSWSILDVAMNRKGDALCYGTWKDSVFYARLHEPTFDNPSGISWTELPIPNHDASMAVFSLRFSRRGHEILCGGSDRCLHVFDLESMSRVVTIPDAHGDDINAVCYGDTESHLLYSGGDDGLVKVYDRRAFGELDYQPVGAFAGHRDGITYIDARGDDRYLISNSKDQTIKLWDLRRFSSEETVRKTINCVRQQSWDYRWQPAPPTTCTPLKGDTSVLTLRGHSVLHTLVRAKFSPSRTGKRYIYTGCARGEVIIYDIMANAPCGSADSEEESSPVIRRLPGHVAVVRDVDWNPSCNEIATCSWDGLTAIWKWDERHDHMTSSEVNRIGAEDSCDEFYQPVVKRRKAAHRKGKLRRKQAPRATDESNDSPELLYTF